MEEARKIAEIPFDENDEGVKNHRGKQKLVLRTRQPQEPPGDQRTSIIIARTAATLSHEINNPLMAITGLVEILLKERQKLPGDMVEKIEQIGSAAERIRKVTEILMEADTFHYRETPSGRIIDLESLLKDEPAR
jgi:signal transduction histidine kinase